MKWYMAEYDRDSDGDHEYEQYQSDEDAINGFTSADGKAILQDIWRCEDDECLTPDECIWP